MKWLLERLRLTVPEAAPNENWHFIDVKVGWLAVYCDTVDTGHKQAWPWLPRIIFRHKAIGIWTKPICVGLGVNRYTKRETA